MINRKIIDEKKYNKIWGVVGSNRYSVFYPEDDFIPVLYGTLPETYGGDFAGVCISSGSTLNVDYICEGIKLAKGAQVIAWRTLRHCNHDGTRHLNATDNIMFPDQKGNIWKVARNDSPDHYVNIATYAGLKTIIQAYHLPEEKQGPYDKYVENGATVPIKIEPEYGMDIDFI